MLSAYHSNDYYKPLAWQWLLLALVGNLDIRYVKALFFIQWHGVLYYEFQIQEINPWG